MHAVLYNNNIIFICENKHVQGVIILYRFYQILDWYVFAWHYV